MPGVVSPDSFLNACGLSATVYTQLSDVEEETNGLLTYDRAVQKLPAERMRTINASLYAALQGKA